MECPICQRPFSELGALNTHVDQTHLSPESPDGIYSDSDDDLRTWLRSKMKLSGKLFEHETALGLINRSLSSLNDYILSPRRSFLDLDLIRPERKANDVQENEASSMDASIREITTQCGLVRDLTPTLVRVRAVLQQRTELRRLQLQQRLERQINTIVSAHKGHQGAFTQILALRNARNKALAESMTYWQEGANCEACSRSFSVVVRKHHCRLCGGVVCGLGCLMEVPLSLLVRGVAHHSDLPEDAQTETLRICVNCRGVLFRKQQYLEDVQRNPGSIVDGLEALVRLETKIESVVSRGLNDEHVRAQLVRLLRSFERESKGILALEQKELSSNEKQMVASARAYSMAYIQEKAGVVEKAQKKLVRKAQKQVKVVGEEAGGVTSVVDLNSAKDHYEIERIRKGREELMILKEQQFLIEKMMENARQERKFDEVVTLKENLKDLDDRIKVLEGDLGDEGF